MKSLELVELGLAVVSALLVGLAYWSVSPLLSAGLFMALLGVALARSVGTAVFLATIAYTAPFAMLFSSLIPALSPESYTLIGSIFRNPYLTSPLYGLTVVSTALATEFLEKARRFNLPDEAVLHTIPLLAVGIAVSSVMVVLVYSENLRTSPLLLPIILLSLPLVLRTSGEKGGKTRVVVKCDSSPVRIELEGEKTELWPNPLTKLDDGKFRVEVLIEKRPRAVYCGEKRLRKMAEGKNGEERFILYA
ncbi:hypothetical protein [Thermococcus sp.]|uniref:hypothetical protein n=1 Tax=Thermococcus sp. TaxID=35749 RepID=UPI0026145161|nr:hypothetical protein [Thermococcus sp.]